MSAKPRLAGLFFARRTAYNITMRSFIFILILLFTPAIALAWSGEVVGVHDGDSITVRRASGKSAKVRIYGVDCPELGQPDGDKARALTARMLLGKTVQVIPAQKAKSYKRVVGGIVLLGDMLVLQDALVSSGLAWVDDRYCKLAVCDLWRLHQREARAAGRGLWRDKSPVPPWVWRRMKHK